MLIAIGLTTLFQNCKKFDDEISIKSNKLFKIVNNKIAVKTKQDLSKLVNKINNMKKEEVKSFYENLQRKNFTSYKPIIEPEYNSDDYSVYTRSSSDDELIADPIFGSLVNDEKEIIVNDSLYKINENGVFFSKVSDSTLLRDFVFNYTGGAIRLV